MHPFKSASRSVNVPETCGWELGMRTGVKSFDDSRELGVRTGAGRANGARTRNSCCIPACSVSNFMENQPSVKWRDETVRRKEDSISAYELCLEMKTTASPVEDSMPMLRASAEERKRERRRKMAGADKRISLLLKSIWSWRGCGNSCDDFLARKGAFLQNRRVYIVQRLVFASVRATAFSFFLHLFCGFLVLGGGLLWMHFFFSYECLLLGLAVPVVPGLWWVVLFAIFGVIAGLTFGAVRVLVILIFWIVR
ncbi:hypothetical protein M5K25_012488 [Dendrobium thyrsiflorum]|uniref:Transmembrane protein n=1 Tax=Dendrobium thyrsiflorum TaxID=117978 RepID=A0ABD0UXN8_DENTH